ncbi:uncharacterized protein LOC127285186 [Leptopilina boulardi]|uniref:uncharacterized protein LOC127285186 n=1 Tax=Leptopilina boulardi TaxID=63433 RepID=UPI0021F69A68|nr:uncharacterized protein LOC127285186 [Leptopilina boulardi]
MKRKCGNRRNNDGRSKLQRQQEQLGAEYLHIKKFKTDSQILCQICQSAFTISSGGKNDIVRHNASEKHKNALKEAASSSQVTDFFKTKNVFGSKEKELAAAEAVLSYHTITHNHSFRSMDCTSRLVQILFEKKFACKRTKTEAIVVNVLAPHAQMNLKTELSSASYVSIYTDSSNHKDLKLFPILVRYFAPKVGTQIKILDLAALPGETSDIIVTYLLDRLENHELKEKLAGYCADNTNANFGGRARQGKNNVFFKLKDKLSQNIIGVGCTAHIVHNTVKSAADLLPIDIENIVVKIYSRFYIYTVRVESLKEFCEEVDIEYKKLLGYSNTRWLALLPAVERILKLFNALKSYFLSLDKCPNDIRNFFNDESSELWLLFIHNQAALFSNTVVNLEGQKVTIMETCRIINDLKRKLSDREENGFLPLTMRQKLNFLIEEGQINEEWFKSQVKLFYNNCLSYLDSWSEDVQIGNSFNWVLLSTVPQWEEVSVTHEEMVQSFNLEINENDLFDELSYVKEYVLNKVNKWNEKKIAIDQRWVEIFQHFESQHVPYVNIVKLVEYCLCLPGTNAPTERVFSGINQIWTSEKSQLSVETLKNTLFVKYNLEGSCEEFYNFVESKEDILRQIHSSEKYA